MKPTKRVFIGALVMLAASSFGCAYAGAPPKAVDEYEGYWRGAIVMCRLVVIQANLDAQRRDPAPGVILYDDDGKPIPEKPPAPKADPYKCVAEATPSVRAAYDKALAATKKPAARAALKEHFIITNAVLKAVVQSAGESPTIYANRMTADTRRLDELWERVKIEY